MNVLRPALRIVALASLLVAAIPTAYAGTPADGRPAGPPPRVVMATAVPGTGPITEGQLRAVSDDGTTLLFPLRHTDVHADIAGIVADVEVVQTFANPYDRPIEAVYVFPLPNHAAVDAMEIHLEDRVIRGVIAKRDEARAAYQAARREGRTAALLDQERPNIFTQAVANILPGDSIEVRIRYFETLPDRAGAQEFVFPMVVGPRFIPGVPVRRGDGGGDPDTTEVPDASRITPPVLGPDERSGHDISVEVRLDAGVRAAHVQSPSHRITVENEDRGVVRVRLAADDTIPNRDFVLRYALDGGAPNVIVLPHRPADGTGPGYFLALLRPEADPPPSAITPKEMIFVVDCSGSMHGEPIAKVREALTWALNHLNPLDNFQIIRFSDAARSFAPAPVPATPMYIEKALDYVAGLTDSGGTIMLEGVKAALAGPEDPQRLRIVAFMTDGYIGNEDAILAYLHDHLRGARLHSFGVGSAVNRYLLDSMAEIGRGSVTYILLRDPTEEAIRGFYDRISRPYLTDLSIDWGRLRVADLHPAEIPDLFLGQPIRLSGRYEEPGSATVTVRGRLGGRPWERRFRVDLPERHPEGEAIASLWAREHLDDLSRRMLMGSDPALVEEATATALEHHLVSAYTSFVAIDDLVRNHGAAPEKVLVPVPIPEGVDRDMAVGPGNRTVAAASPIVTMATTSPQTTISAEFIDALPILGRNYQDVLTLAPGVAGTTHGARDVEMREQIRVVAGPPPGPPAGAVAGGVVGGVVGGVLGGVLGSVESAGDGNPGAVKIACRIESSRGDYSVGEPIEIILTLTNLAAHPVEIPVDLSVADGSARFQILDSAWRALPDPVDMCVDGGHRTLMTGASATYVLVLNGPGGYRLDGGGTYSVIFLGAWYGLPDSNRLTITIRRN
jgi:Ca-activated chloride channel family protein